MGNENEILPLVNVKQPKGQEFNRTTSIISDPQVKDFQKKKIYILISKSDECNQFNLIFQASCLQALKESNIQLLRNLLEEARDEIDVNHAYPDEKYKTLLHVAIEKGQYEAIQLLLKANSDPNLPNRLTQQTPIHVAANKLPVLEVFRLLQSYKANVNAVNAGGKNVVHLLVQKSLQAKSLQEGRKLQDCLRHVLDQRDINIDRKDDIGHTPLFIAANSDESQSSYFDVTRLLVSKGADWSISVDEEQIRDILKRKLSRKQFRELLEVVDSTPITTLPLNSAILASILNLIDEAEFGENVEKFAEALELALPTDLVHDVPGQLNALQRACQLGLSNHVQLLLEKGTNINKFSKGTTPALISCVLGGHLDTLKVIIDHKSKLPDNAASFSVVDAQTKSSVLHTILRKPFKDNMLLSRPDEVRYKSCLTLILETSTKEENGEMMRKELQKVVNVLDEFGNAAIHYATQLWDQDTVRSLLELGANIGLKNVYNEVPIENIFPDTLESFLNEVCMETEGNVTNKDFRVTMKYDFLAPARDDWDTSSQNSTIKRRNQGWLKNNEVEDLEEKIQHNEEDEEPASVPLPETEVLWYMSQSKEHRHLLKHPVITTFLWLKWKKISKAYNKNLIFYFILVACLTWYILALYGGNSITTSNFSVEKCLDEVPSKVVQVLWHINLVLVVFLLLREIIQFGIAPRRYFFSFENWLELVLIALILFLLLHGGYGCHVTAKRHVAAIAIVLSWAEFITMIGRHPKLSTYNVYVTMFYKVTSTFIMFLAWYSLFIFAFALGFYILLHKDQGQEVDEDEYPFFNEVGLSIIKTFTMFVGELEFGDLPIETPIGYIFFLAFIFLIVVVMMNLLNGLAVSDTGVIRAEAELNFYRCQVDVISYVEAMLLGDPFNFLSNWPSFIWLRRLPSCSLGNALYRVPPIRSLFHFFSGASEILLFYQILPDKRLTFYPNHNPIACSCLGGDNKEIYFPRYIVEHTKHVIQEHQRSLDSIEQRIFTTEQLLEKLLENQSKLGQDLQKLISFVGPKGY